MKKIFAIVLALSILFAFCACNKNTENSGDDSTEDTEAEKALTELAGKSPKDLYNSAIEYIKSLAKNLLKYSDMAIKEIVFKLNFPNQSVFYKFFKVRTGMTPSEYRNS